MALARVGREVLVLESGGLEPDADSARLNGGRMHGLPALPLTETRYRGLGGSTARWEGRCLALDPLDFEPRPWVPESGWPFPASELDPFYRDAWRWCGLPASLDEVREAELAAAEGLGLGDRLALRYAVMHPVRFGGRYRAALARSPRIRVLLRATVREILTSAGGEAVIGVEAVTGSGVSFRVRAARTVLAASGIENPRLLLLARGGRGLGGGPLGRFFMDHPYLNGMAIHRPDPGLVAAFRQTSRGRHGLLTLGERLLRSERLLNSAGYLVPVWPFMESASYERRSVRAVRELVHHLRVRPTGVRLRDRFGAALPGFGPASLLAARRLRQRWSRPPKALLRIVVEPAPLGSNRIELGTELDALGMPLPEIHWRIAELERRSYDRYLECVAAWVTRSALGRPEPLFPPGDESWIAGMHNGKHPMGATRMHDDPARGVVDRHGRVHGVANLYVTGASVFPTYGIANSTLTIVALALRLADHLASNAARAT
jgi:choline dehydrogenase-like flavoprotein